LIEGFIPGREYALEGLLHLGQLRTLALFDKPDPLDGPFFEETVYVTPSSAPEHTQRAIVDAVAQAAKALGLWHGAIHAECRVNPDGVFVLEVAARPIGGLCARALRFQPTGAISAVVSNQSSIPNKSAIRTPQSAIPLEELLLRHALGEAEVFQREPSASGVMMIPIPKRGIFRRVDGLDEARGVAGVDEIHVTAKPDQLLVPLPEGASYLGFIFARAERPEEVDRALRDAHARLAFTIEPDWPVLAPGQIHYNLSHG